MEVVEVEDLPTSGSTHWSSGLWIIVINGLEPWQRQRFSIGHELWHVINYKTVTNLLPAERFRTLNAERLADYFSGCLHLPAATVRAHLQAGYQVDDLANLFGVSAAAVTVRLSQLHLAVPERRAA